MVIFILVKNFKVIYKVTPLIKENFMKVDFPLCFINSVVNVFRKAATYPAGFYTKDAVSVSATKLGHLQKNKKQKKQKSARTYERCFHWLLLKIWIWWKAKKLYLTYSITLINPDDKFIIMNDDEFIIWVDQSWWNHQYPLKPLS